LTSSTFPLVRRSQYSLAGTFHGQKIPLAENRFLQADNGAENTKEKIEGVLYLHHWIIHLRKKLNYLPTPGDT